MQNLIPSLKAAGKTRKCHGAQRPERTIFCFPSLLTTAAGDLSLLYVRARARFGGVIMPLVATFKTDWFRVITDLTRKNLTTQEIANELGVSKSAVLGWKSGSEPRHGHGEALIALWCMATSSDRKKLPTVLHRQWFTFRKSRFGRETDQACK